MTKPIGPICNLDCKYCFYLEKEKLYPDQRTWKMSDEVLDAYIRQYVESQQVPEINFAWQGGEPTLLGVEFFRKAVALQQTYADGKTIHNAIQTNGTLLDEQWGRFLAEHKFLVGLSIDGPRELHDAYRVDKQQRPTFDQVMHGLSFLNDAGVEWNALTTVHAANGDRGREVYRFLRDECGARFIQFIPIIERVAADQAEDGTVPWESWRDRPLYVQEGEVVTGRSVSPAQYGRFLVDVFEEWVRRDVGEVYVQMFDVTLANWVGEPPGLCVHSETCGLALALEHTGDLYSCDHFVEPRYLLGNIKEHHMLELVSSPQQTRFGLDKRDTLPQYCLDCDVRFACHGGCPKDRFTRTPYGEPGLNYLCAGFKEFFHHVDGPMRVMGELLSRNRAPAEIMGRYATEDAKRGRNDLCTCGSGQKWKRCHGAEPQPASPTRLAEQV